MLHDVPPSGVKPAPELSASNRCMIPVLGEEAGPYGMDQSPGVASCMAVGQYSGHSVFEEGHSTAAAVGGDKPPHYHSSELAGRGHGAVVRVAEDGDGISNRAVMKCTLSFLVFVNEHADADVQEVVLGFRGVLVEHAIVTAAGKPFTWD